MNGWWGFLISSAGFQAEPADNIEGPTINTETITPVLADVAQAQSSLTIAPGFVLPDLLNASLEYSLNDYIGRPVILNFWASWCVPCRFEMPALQRAYEDHRDSGLVVLGVNQTFMDNPVAARDFVDELALTFPNARDDTGTTSEALYQVMGLPISVFITADGEIAHRQIGQMTDAQIENFSRQLTTGEAITP
jgi:thiol-disulfide isomerase/thioredoxin